MAAADGQSLATQSPQIQQSFVTAFGDNAAASWDAKHNEAIGAGGGQPYRAQPDQGQQGQAVSSVSAAQLAVSAADAAAKNVIATAQQKAQQAYWEALAKGASDTLAFNQATQAFNQAVTEAGLTGTYQGQQTLAAIKQANDVAVQQAGVTGYYTAPGSSTASATLAREQLNQTGGLAVLDLLGKLTGPANAFQQQAVINGLDATGMSRAVGAIQGKYGLPSFQAPQANPQAATVQSLMDQAGGTSGNWVGAPALPDFGTQSQAAQDYWNTNYRNLGFASPQAAYATTWAKDHPNGTPAMPAFETQSQGAQDYWNTNYRNLGFASPQAAYATTWAKDHPANGAGSSQDQGSQATPAVNNIVGGTHIHLNTAGGPSTPTDPTTAYVNSLPAPNKINGPAWMRLDKDTQGFLTSAYGAAGYSPNQVTGAVAAGLPQFKAPSMGSVNPAGLVTG